ncbi:MAG: amine dehydrogenase, partial [Gammaproteobacteria bacterium]|nr:amine dehydrogenase [Gammaproteobacteria bacterium]
MKKLLLLAVAVSVTAYAEIRPETMGVIQTLPSTYPPHWVIVQDSAFFHMSDGKFIVIDADSDDPAARFKGMLNASFIAQFHQAKTRPEMYVAETFHSRGNRGVRTDVLTIYDKTTL